MANVDDRIVSLKFDNLSFQKNVDATIKSLEKLKTSLNFTGTEKGFTNLAQAGKKVDLSHLADSVDRVSQKFSALNAVAFAALSNITNKAINAGEALVKSLSLDQTLQGFNEYETNINAIQTILANTSEKGTTLEQVNNALDELNKYSDQTIYNFSQMTKNVGTFTAAGVNLDTAVASIKGFSNVAAMGGANAEQAASAMYQLSQGLATGTIRLIDWKSLQANQTGNEVFQKYLFETGKALGTLNNVPIGQSFEDWKKSGNSFNASLEKGWLTAEVMTTTLNAFTGDLTEAQLVALGYTEQQAAALSKISGVAVRAATEVKTLRQLFSVVREAVGSGWSQTFRTVFGTFNEARDLFTGWNMGISQLVGANAGARNAILDEWKSLGGRSELIAGITIAFNDLLLVFRVVKNAFRDVFPRKTGAQLYSITVRFRELAQKLALTGDTAKKIGNILRGFFMIFKFGFNVISLAFGVFKKIFGLFSGAAGSGLINVLSGLSTKLQEFLNKITASGKIEGFFARINQQINKFKNSYLPKIVQWLKEFADIARTLIDTYGRKLIATFKDLGAYLASVGSTIKNFFISAFEKVLSIFNRTSTSSQNTISQVKKVEEGFISFSDVGKKVSEVFKKFVAILSGIKNGVVGAGKFIKNAFVSIKEGLNSFFNSRAYDQMLRGVDRGLIGGLILLFRKFLDGGLVDMIGGKGVSKSIVKLINGVTGVFKTMQTELRADALLRIAKALALIAISLIALSFVNPGKIAIGLGYLSVALVELVAAIYALNKIGSDVAGAQKLALLSLSLLLISAALVTFAIALALLSAIQPQKLINGVAAMTLVITELGWFLSTFDKDTNPKNIFAAALSLWAMGSAMGKLADAISILGSMDLGVLIQGFVAVSAIMFAIVAAIHHLPDNADSKLGGILALSISMRIFASSIKVLGNMPMDKLKQGFLAFILVLGFLVAALESIDENRLGEKAGVVLALAAAVSIITGALVILGLASPERLLNSLLAFTAIILLLMAAVEVLDNKTIGAQALVAIAGGILLLGLALQTLSQLSVGNIIAGLVAIAGTLAIVLIAATVAETVLPGLWALGDAILFIGAGFALLGVGALAFAQAFSIVSNSGDAAIGVFKNLLKTGITLIPDLISALVTGLLNGFLQFSESLVQIAPAIIENVSKVLLMLLDAANKILPEFAKTIDILIDILLKALVKWTPTIIQAGFTFLMALLNGIANNITEVVTSVGTIIVNFLNALDTQLPSIITAGTQLLTDFLDGVADAIPDIAQSITDVIVAFTTEIGKHVDDITNAGFQLFIDLFEGLASTIRARSGDLGVAIGHLVSALVIGIGNALRGAIRTIANDLFPGLGSVVGAIMDWFGGDSQPEPEITIGAKVEPKVVGGRQTAIKIKQGLIRPVNEATSSLNELSTTATATFARTTALIRDFNGIADINPTITPVLDLTNVEKGAERINGFITPSKISADVSAGQAAFLSNATAAQNGSDMPQNQVLSTEIKFEQNVYSPKMLSVGELYRQTRNQITLAKEELSIL